MLGRAGSLLPTSRLFGWNLLIGGGDGRRVVLEKSKSYAREEL